MLPKFKNWSLSEGHIKYQLFMVTAEVMDSFSKSCHLCSCNKEGQERLIVKEDTALERSTDTWLHSTKHLRVGPQLQVLPPLMDVSY